MIWAASVTAILSQTQFLNIPVLEWIGYLASVLLVISMIMASIIKLRWINLFGAAIFSAYGFLIAAYPVALLNLFITFADIYYLARIYRESDSYRMWKIGDDKRYLDYFSDHYSDEIRRYYPGFDHKEIKDRKDRQEIFILRNLVPAGLIIARETDPRTVFIDLDFAIPRYRDLKLGRYFYKVKGGEYKARGFERFETEVETGEHARYMEKVGFKLKTGDGGKGIYVRSMK